MALFDDVNRKLQALGNSVTAIGEAAKNKGAPLDPETTPLSEWAGAIDNIPIEPLEWIADPLTNQLVRPYYPTSFTFPTEATDGTPLSTTFDPVYVPMYFACLLYQKIIIPEYFTSVKFNNITNYFSDWISWAFYREMEIHATGVVEDGDNLLPHSQYLQKLYCATKGEFDLRMRTRYKTITELGETSVLDIPNATSLTSRTLGVYWNAEKVDTFIINAPKITALGPTSNYDFGIDWCGDNTFPEVTSLNCLKNPRYAGFVNTVKLPKLSEITTYFMYSTGLGKLVLYVGPNLTDISSTSRVINNITNGYLEIHIPAGDSTTKTYLDNNGINYIQDYTI